jgi:hypothetical protein
MSNSNSTAYAQYDLDVVAAMAEKAKAAILAFRAEKKKEIIDSVFDDLVEILRPKNSMNKILNRFFYSELVKYSVSELRYLKENSDVEKVAKELLGLHSRSVDTWRSQSFEYDQAKSHFESMFEICEGIIRSTKRNFDAVTELNLVGDFADANCVKDGMITLDVRYFNALYDWASK